MITYTRQLLSALRWSVFLCLSSWILAFAVAVLWLVPYRIRLWLSQKGDR